MYCKTKLVSLWMLLSRITGKLRIWKMMLFEESWKLYSPYDLSVMIVSSTAWFLCSKTTCLLQKICYQLPHCCALLPFEFKSAEKSICFFTDNIFYSQSHGMKWKTSFHVFEIVELVLHTGKKKTSKQATEHCQNQQQT